MSRSNDPSIRDNAYTGFYYLLISYTFIGMAYFSGYYLIAAILLVPVLLHPFLHYNIHPHRFWRRFILWYLMIYSGYLLNIWVKNAGFLKWTDNNLLIGLQFSFAATVVFLLYADSLKESGGKVLITLFAVTLIPGLRRENSGYFLFIAIFMILLFFLFFSENINRRGSFSLGSFFLRFDIWGYMLLYLLLFTGMINAVPFSQLWLQDKVRRHLLDSIHAESGFSEFSRIGSIGRIQKKTDPVLRVFSPHPLYLAGRVYDRYINGLWLSQNKSKRITKGERLQDKFRYRLIPRAPPSTEKLGTVSIIDVRSAIYFLPGKAAWFESGEAEIEKDVYGMVSGKKMGDYSFGETYPDFQRAKNPTRIIAGPDTMNKVRKLAREIVGEEKDIRKKIGHITRFFHSSFQYSLEVKPHLWKNHIETFLFTSRAGHCEYFATAMVFLLDALKIQARYVTGYFANEYNSYGNYFLVRSQDAHAWVEAYLPGEGWQLFDPTPPGWTALSSSQTSLHDLLDYIKVLCNRMADRVKLWFTNSAAQVENLRGNKLLASALFLAAFFLFYRLVRLFDPSKIRCFLRSQFQRLIPGEDKTTREFKTLLAGLEKKLGKKGMQRGKCETIEEYKLRIHQSHLEEPVRETAESILEELSRFRYGNKPFDGERLARMKKTLNNLLFLQAKNT